MREQLLDAAEKELEASRGDLELAAGAVRVKGSPDKPVTIADLAGSGTPFLGKGSGDVPEAPEVDASACVGRLGMESFLAPQLITHAAHVKVDRETGVVRVLRFAAAHDSGMIVNKIGADGQVYGGVVMGIGQALSEGTQFDEDGRQRNPHLLDYKLDHGRGRARDHDPLGRGRHAERRAQGLEGRGRAAERPHLGRRRQRHRQGHRPARQAAADDARARVERGAGGRA